MVKPKICDILGVEVDELFCISRFPGTKFYIESDGTFSTIPNNVPMSSKWLLRAIENPEYVIKLKSNYELEKEKLTEDEKFLCVLIKKQFPWAKCIMKHSYECITIYQNIPKFDNKEATGGKSHPIPEWMFPSLKSNKFITL